jgi:hypothetical protein
MAYYIFLKSWRILEEFRKKTHIKIPPKSTYTNFRSLSKFKNPIFIPKRFSLQISAESAQLPTGLFNLSAHVIHPGLFFLLHPRRLSAASSSCAAVPWPPHCPPPTP